MFPLMKNDILNIRLDILDKKRQKLLGKLLPFTKGFVLGGGTALSLQLAHRVSFDFDFFSSFPIPKQLLERLSQEIKIKNIVVDTSDELTFFTKDAVKVTFLYYPFLSDFAPMKAENGLPMFPIAEIAIHKAYAIGRRGEYRDYFDLYTILKDNYVSLNTLIPKVKKVYGSVFDEKIFLEQLVYFGDITNFEIIAVPGGNTPKPEEVKRYFQGIVKTYLK